MAKVADDDLLPGKVDDADLEPEGTGEAGVPGHDQYAAGPHANQRPRGEPSLPLGGLADAAISWADTAALGGGAQIAGAMGAVAHSITDPFGLHGSDDDAYEFVRDQAKARIDKAADTGLGIIAKPLGMISTPGIPGAVKGASLPARGLQAAKVGGAVGGLQAAFSSKGDLTKADYDNIKKFLLDTAVGIGSGAVVGGATGLGVAAAQKPLQSMAEGQALRAAGLRAGIKNSVQNDLGLKDMDDARELGRKFLNEKLIPLIGSSEAVARRAEALQGRASAAKNAVLNDAEASGTKMDFTEFADAARRKLDGATATADEMAGAKARKMADTLEHQGERTPGSFIGADKTKSDAWASADFRADPPVSARLYRQSVGAARDNLEDQVSRALGPDSAAALRSANGRYGVAADALKLARNNSTRESAKSGIGPMKEALALLGGSVAGGAAGHPAAGAGLGLASALGLKAYDSFGHSSAARFADFLSKRAANNTGGAVGGRIGDALARYLELLDDKDAP